MQFFLKLLKCYSKEKPLRLILWSKKKALRKTLQAIEDAGLLLKEISKMTIVEDNQNRFITSTIVNSDAATSIALLHPAVANGAVFIIYLSIPTGFGYDLDTHTDLLHKWASTFKIKN